jgi:hypothetical protein
MYSSIQLHARGLPLTLESLAKLDPFCSLGIDIGSVHKTGLGSSAALITSLVDRPLQDRCLSSSTRIRLSMNSLLSTTWRSTHIVWLKARLDPGLMFLRLCMDRKSTSVSTATYCYHSCSSPEILRLTRYVNKSAYQVVS